MILLFLGFFFSWVRLFNLWPDRTVIAEEIRWAQEASLEDQAQCVYLQLSSSSGCCSFPRQNVFSLSFPLCWTFLALRM